MCVSGGSCQGSADEQTCHGLGLAGGRARAAFRGPESVSGWPRDIHFFLPEGTSPVPSPGLAPLGDMAAPKAGRMGTKPIMVIVVGTAKASASPLPKGAPSEADTEHRRSLDTPGGCRERGRPGPALRCQMGVTTEEGGAGTASGEGQLHQDLKDDGRAQRVPWDHSHCGRTLTHGARSDGLMGEAVSGTLPSHVT